MVVDYINILEAPRTLANPEELVEKLKLITKRANVKVVFKTDEKEEK